MNKKFDWFFVCVFLVGGIFGILAIGEAVINTYNHYSNKKSTMTVENCKCKHSVSFDVIQNLNHRLDALENKFPQEPEGPISPPMHPDDLKNIQLRKI